MQNAGKILIAVLLSIICRGALAQFSLSIQTNKPQKPVLGLPFSAEQSVTVVQNLAGAAPLTSEIKGHVYRSAAGVERYDVDVRSTDPAHPGTNIMGYIVDHAKGVTILINEKTKTATVQQLPENSTVSFKALPLQPARYQNRVVQPDPPTVSDLGSKPMGLIKLKGKRSTAMIPAGKIGNDKPLAVTTEVWFYAELQLLVEEVEKNPLTGERTYELTHIHGEEPDPALFEIPADYTTKEAKPIPTSVSSMLGQLPPDQLAIRVQSALSGSSPSMKNSVAYALAENDAQLGDAQTLAEQAVALEEEETAKVSAKGDSDKSYSQTNLLTSYWDTLGWVFYRQGKQEQAETYLRAAWTVKPNADVALHLGSVYEAEHRPKEAIAIYRMTLSLKISSATRAKFQDRLEKLGQAFAEPVLLEIDTALPPLEAPVSSLDPELQVEVLIGHAAPPVVTYPKGEPTGASSLTHAIQSALAQSLPDSGPEVILRRARVSCKADQPSVCELHFLTSGAAK